MRASTRLSLPKLMRASIELCLRTSSLALLVLAAAGCQKEVKADFPRPPATATLPPPEEEPESAPPAPVLEEPEVVEPIERASEVEEEEKPAEAPARPPKPVPPAEEKKSPEEPPETTLVGGGEVDPELASKLERASSLLQAISRRNLTSDQADQLMAARGFVAQARQALGEGDPRRALVLADKALILAEDVDRLSRP